MTRTCTICKHEARDTIDGLLVQRASYRNIAQRFAVSVTALHRHKQHLGEHLVKAAEAQEVLSASKLLADLQALQQRAIALLDKAESSGDLRVALQGVREAREVIASMARILEVSQLEARITALEEHLEVKR